MGASLVITGEPSITQAYLVPLQGRRCQVNQDVESHGDEEDGSDQVRPHIHRLIVDLEQRSGTLPIRVVADAPACRQVRVVLDVLL